MKLAIHKSSWGFSPDWIQYCLDNNIPHKVVNCYDSDIIRELSDCDVLLWHHHHTHVKDVLFAKQLLFALQQAGKKVFPDFNTGWHFDDKVGQKYLLEAVHAPVPESYVFYEKSEALHWADTVQLPKVFKLRGGAGSNNVKLIRTKADARSVISQAFSGGFSNYNKWVDLRENVRRWRLGKNSIVNVLKSVRRMFVSTAYARVTGRQKGYAYFQEFIPNNTFDIRVVTIGKRAFAIKRLTRDGDFRASGSGFIVYDPNEIPMACVSTAFEVSKKLNALVVAYDFVISIDGKPLIVEINYGYAHKSYFDCPGYWNESLQWIDGRFNSAFWIIEEMISMNKQTTIKA